MTAEIQDPVLLNLGPYSSVSLIRFNALLLSRANNSKHNPHSSNTTCTEHFKQILSLPILFIFHPEHISYIDQALNRAVQSSIDFDHGLLGRPAHRIQ